MPFSSSLQFFREKDNFTYTKERKKAWEKQLLSLHIRIKDAFKPQRYSKGEASPESTLGS